MSERRELTTRELQGNAAPWETAADRNKRMGWGCECHGASFCPDWVCVDIVDDVPVFERRPTPSSEGEQ